jgi:hypothetical protein
MTVRTLLVVVCFATACCAQETKPPKPLTVGIGSLTLRPTGFLDAIGMSRSATTADSVWTHFGSIPLAATPGQSFVSLRHSRLLLKGDLPWNGLKLSGYLESDFLNITAGQSAWRWRQYWGQVQLGKWEILGGQAWSLLRPNRKGIASDKDLMSTDVIDPGYHVGLLGLRRRQFRLARALGDYKAVFAWETQGNFLAKATVDKRFGHAELTAFTGHRGRKGVTVAGVFNVSQRLKLVTQEYWSKRAAFEAMGVVPTGPNGMAAIQGVEYRPCARLELYSYGGLVYASRTAGNRLVREWTAGADYRIGIPSIWGNVLLSVQYSQMDRSLWTGRSGAMNYLMYRARYTFN